jgi:hypothetical protein
MTEGRCQPEERILLRHAVDIRRRPTPNTAHERFTS